MSGAAALVADCRARGIRLIVDGDRLRARGRALPPDLAERLRAAKPTVLALLAAEPVDAIMAARLRAAYATLDPAERERVDAEAAAGDHLTARILAAVATPEPCAWLLHSRRLGCAVWLLANREAEAVLTAADRTTPAIYADELPALHGLDTDAVRAVLDAKVAFGAGTTLADPAAVLPEDLGKAVG